MIQLGLILYLLSSKGENECYIEVFRGDGDNWSFVMPSNDVKNEVIATSEKNKFLTYAAQDYIIFLQLKILFQHMNIIKIYLKKIGMLESYI